MDKTIYLPMQHSMLENLVLAKQVLKLNPGTDAIEFQGDYFRNGVRFRASIDDTPGYMAWIKLESGKIVQVRKYDEDLNLLHADAIPCYGK